MCTPIEVFVAFHVIWLSLDVCSRCFNAWCKSKPRHRHQEEEVGRLCDVPRWNEESPGLHLSWAVPLASTKNAPDRSAQDCEASGNVQKTAQIVPESAREIGLRARGCAATARWVARDPAARKPAQVKVRPKFCVKNVETTKCSKLALAEELATLGGCEPIHPLCEVTLLTVAGALQATGRHRLTSLSCDCDMLSWTPRFHWRSTRPSRKSTML